MPLAEIPQDLALMLVAGSGAIWLGPIDRSKDKSRKGEPASSCPELLGTLLCFLVPMGVTPPTFNPGIPPTFPLGAFLWMQIISNSPANPGPAPKTTIPEWLGLGLGLGLGAGVAVGSTLGSVTGLEVGAEQQTMGQGWLEHRSKVRRAGPEAELVTEETRAV